MGKIIVGALMRGGPWEKRHESIRRVYRIDGISPTLTAGGGGGTETKVILFEDEIGESDNLTDLIKRYDADEHYDFTYASLFSGIGGFEQALNRFGGHCVFSSEIDKFAAKAYETLYGHKPTGDITKIDAKDVPDHDMLVGGFPCQAFSVAGKRKGFEDTRGTLFFEIARIAKEKHPKALLLENVKGLVNHDKGRTLDIMIETLNEIGYTVDFEILNSKYFGVPQNRERIFIVAIRDDLIEQEDWSEETTKGQTVVPRGKRRLMKYEWLKSFNFDWPEQDEVTTRLRDILESEVDEKYYLDEDKTSKLVTELEAKNPEERMSRQAIETFNKTEKLVEHGDMIQAYNKQHLKDGICPTLTTRPEGFKTATLPVVNSEPCMLGHIDIKGNDSIKRTYSTDGIGNALTTMGGGHREPKIAEPLGEVKQIGYIDKNIQGNRVYDVDGVGATIASQTGGLGGRGVTLFSETEVRPVLTPDRIEKRQNGRRFKEDGEPAFTVNTQDRHGVAIREATKKGYAIAEVGDSVNVQFPNSKTRRGRVGKQIANTLEASSINQGVVTPRYRIRKLSPIECWRLQGFPDEAHEAVKQAGVSDSQRYKQAGNAVTVNVIEAIAERLIPLITK